MEIYWEFWKFTGNFWKFTGNFGNFLGFLEIYWDFWKVSGNLPEIFHPFATLVVAADAFYKLNVFYCCNMKIKFNMKDVTFSTLLKKKKMTKEVKPK